MADFNQISVNSAMTVVSADPATLCFNDGKLLLKSQYAIANNTLNLVNDSSDFLSVYMNNGIGRIYEFKSFLYSDHPSLPILDYYHQEVNIPAKNNILVFVDGELQPSNLYEVEYNQEVEKNILTFNISYTNDVNRQFDVVTYVNNDPITRYTYSLTEISQLDLNEIRLPFTYNIDNTIIFVNGFKVPFDAIQVLDNTNTFIKLNIHQTVEEIEEFEIIKFINTNTTSYHFYSRSGYLSYGPYDEYGKKLPNLYDTILKFSDQAKILIDNLRSGFIVKELNNNGQAVIVDDSFETKEVKALQVQPFGYTSLKKNEYYLLVPEYTNIIKYLAEFDNRYTFLPEILTIFQRLLLDEIHDEIQRLRDSRSIHKVDSDSINKLIGLLGFNANIKTLNNKQRHELLEELNEFYRIVGTRDSYNLLNILQNDLKLINIEQLFTPFGNHSKSKKTVYNYITQIKEGNGGIDYKVGDYLKTNTGTNANINITVTDVDENGTITAGVEGRGYNQETGDGYIELNGDYPLESGVTGSFNISTPTIYWNYHWTINNSIGYRPGQILRDSTNSYRLRVDTVDSEGRILTWTPLSSTTGFNEVSLTAIGLFLEHTNTLTLRVNHSNLSEDPSSYEADLVYYFSDGGQSFGIELDPGVYYVEAAGAGGAGGAADSRTGNEYDWPADNGSNGELKTKYFTVTTRDLYTCVVGEGGGRVKARGHDSTPYREVRGTGFNNGQVGQMQHVNASYRTGYSSNGYSSYGYVRGNIAGGQGGGSSGIRDKFGIAVIEARGGNGGKGYTNKLGLDKTVYTALGGEGGGGGVTSGNGGAGGSRAYGGDFWSKNGSNGWIKIYRVKQKYSFEVLGDTSLVSDNDEFSVIIPDYDPTLKDYLNFHSIAHTAPDGVSFTTTPTEGYLPLDMREYELQSVNSNRSAKLDVSSTFNKYGYVVDLLVNDIGKIRQGDIFTSQDNTIPTFTYTVTSINTETGKIYGKIVPDNGTIWVEKFNVPTTINCGSGGILTVTSVKNTQKNEDRCYIDFYTREELGAIQHKEYRINSTDYGYVNEGTPNSPKFWEVGEPDINYEGITDPVKDIVNYGLITEKVRGKWVEWWEWNRESLWYPTNHVQLELKLPNGVNFDDFGQTFVEQFYNLASTVVYIHAIIESFYFGMDITDGSSPADNSGGSLGIMTGAPVMDMITTVTSDPTIQLNAQFSIMPDPSAAYRNQIIQYIGNTDEDYISGYWYKCVENNGIYSWEIAQYTLEVIPTPTDATVILEADGFTQQGNSITTNYGTDVTWRVEKAGYVPSTGLHVIKKDLTKYIILENETYSDPKYCTFIVKSNPEDAIIQLEAAEHNPIIGSNKDGVGIQVLAGTKVRYTISKDGYFTTTETVLVTTDDTITVDLERIPLPTYTLTINPTPVDATVILEADGYEQEDNSITVEIGTDVTYTVSEEHYVTQSDMVVLTGDKILNTDLQIANYTIDINPIPLDATVILEANGYTQEGNSITVPYNTEVTYSVSKEQYGTISNTIIATEDASLFIELVREPVTLTVNPIPNDAYVTLRAAGYTQVGNSIAVAPGTEVTCIVSKAGYISTSRTVTVNATGTITIELEVARYTLTVDPTPSDAIVTLSAQSGTQSGNSITVDAGTEVTYSVSKTGYIPQNNLRITVMQDQTLPIVLDDLIYTLTINPTPADAMVTIRVPGTTPTINSGTTSVQAREGTEIEYVVEKIDYEPVTDTVILDNNTTLNVTLQQPFY